MIKEAPKYGKREKEDMLLKTLFGYADRYLEKSSWKDLALIKFCLFAIGIMVGIRIPEKGREHAGRVAAFVFAVTYVPLMAKFFGIISEAEKER